MNENATAATNAVALERMEEFGLRYVILHGDEMAGLGACSPDQIEGILGALHDGAEPSKLARIGWLTFNPSSRAAGCSLP